MLTCLPFPGRLLAVRRDRHVAPLALVFIAALVGACNSPMAAQAPLRDTSYLPVALQADPTTIAASVPPPPSAPGRDRWTSYTSSRRSVAVALDPSAPVIWVGTSAGGAVRWNTANGTHRVYTPADGLPRNGVFAVVVDSSGTAWLGTRAGLTRVTRGGEWMSFSLGPDTQSWVANLVQSPDGTLWIATAAGVVHARFDGTSLEVLARYTVADGLPRDRITCVTVDYAGAVWIGTDAGASRREGDGTWRTFTVADGLSSDRVAAVAADNGGGMWFGTDDGASYRAPDGSWTTVLAQTGPTPIPDEGLVSHRVDAIATAGDGTAWFGLYDRLIRRAPDGSWESFPSAKDETNYAAIKVDDGGRVWSATSYGLERLAPDGTHTLFVPEGLLSDRVNALAPDGRSGMWFGTDDGASHRDANGSWTHVQVASGANAIAVEGDGSVWFGTFDGATRRAPDGTLITLTTADGLADDRVNAVLMDASGNHWFGTERGLSRMSPNGSWRTFTTSNGLAADRVQVLRQDATGYLWVGTGGGVTRMRTDGSEPRSFRRELPSPGIRGIGFEPNGVTWLATDYGVARSVDGQSWWLMTARDRLSADWVLSLEAATSGGAWIGTNRGVRHAHGDSITSYTVADGLLDNLVQCVAVDVDGAVWFGTDGGASRFMP